MPTKICIFIDESFPSFSIFLQKQQYWLVISIRPYVRPQVKSTWIKLGGKLSRTRRPQRFNLSPKHPSLPGCATLKYHYFHPLVAHGFDFHLRPFIFCLQDYFSWMEMLIFLHFAAQTLFSGCSHKKRHDAHQSPSKRQHLFSWQNFTYFKILACKRINYFAAEIFINLWKKQALREYKCFHNKEM